VPYLQRFFRSALYGSSYGVPVSAPKRKRLQNEQVQRAL
jgi:hypothetical protein